MGSENGLTVEKLLALVRYESHPVFSDEERVALEYADAITRTDLDVSDDLFARVRSYFDEDQVVELTAAIAWENCSSKFNRALRVESQNLWADAGPR